MRIVLILAALAGIAYLFDQKWLGGLVLFFIIGCALWGFGDFLKDASDGYGFSAKGQLRRQGSNYDKNWRRDRK